MPRSLTSNPNSSQIWRLGKFGLLRRLLHLHLQACGFKDIGICLLTKDAPMPLLNHAAKECFYSLPRVFLQRLEIHLGLAIADGGLAGALVHLVQEILKPSPEELLDIIAKSVTRSNTSQEPVELLAMEGVEVWLSKSDGKHAAGISESPLHTAVRVQCRSCVCRPRGRCCRCRGPASAHGMSGA